MTRCILRGCKVVHVRCQGTDIITDFYILPIVGCQMVLGVNWMQSLDEISLNFWTQQFKLTKGKRTWQLKGIQSKPMEVVLSEMMDRSVCQMAKGWVIYACSKIDTTLDEMPNSLHPDMEILLKEFATIFEEPKEWSPKRTHDHQVPLVSGAEPVNLRPYRHLWEQKNVIEKMIIENAGKQ